MDNADENNTSKPTTDDSKSEQLSFSDWKKLKNSLNRKETTKTPNTFSQRRNQHSYNNRPIQQQYVAPLVPPPALPPLLQRNMYIKPLMATMVPPPGLHTSPLIPQLAPFVIARNQRRFNSTQSSSFNKPFTRPQQKMQRPTQRQSTKNPIPQQHEQKPQAPQQQQKSQESPKTQKQVSKPTTIAPTFSGDVITTAPAEKAPVEAQIFVKRPPQPSKKFSKEKVWIPKPPLPPPINAITPELREEKQRLWREYRQAMKPFKCREFANAKRTVQRLGKKNKDELDEKQLVRLQRAEEAVSEHKAMLSQRAAIRSVKIQDQVRAQEAKEKMVIGNGNLNATNTQGNPNVGSSTDNQYQNNTSHVNRAQGHNNIKNSQQQGHDARSRYAIGNFVSAGFWNTSNGIISK